MKIKPSYVVISILIILSLVLAYDAFTSYVNPYLTVSQVVDNSAAYMNKEINVIGTVANGSVNWSTNSTLSFILTDNRSTINVAYEGSALQNFNEGQQVVVIGKLVSADAINSSKMLVKCPSKYEGDQTSLLTDPVFLIAIILGGAALAYYVATVVLKKS